MAKKEKKETRLDLTGQDRESIVTQLNSKYGANTLILASQALGLKLQFIPTGVADLDVVLGGGIPKNRISEINALYSCGKTTLALCAVRNFQMLHPDGNAHYIDKENSLDLAYAKRLGVDLDRMILAQPVTGEEASDTLAEVLTPNDKDIFVVLDSIAACKPSAVLEASADQQFMGRQAALIGRMMGRANSLIKAVMFDSDAPTKTLLNLNQIRQKPTTYGDPEIAPGGIEREHVASVILRLRSSKSDAITEQVKKNGISREVSYGQVIRYAVKKNKVGGDQHAEGEFKFFKRDYKGYTGPTFDNDVALFNLGVFYDVIKVVPVKKDKTVWKWRNISVGKEHLFCEKIRELDQDDAFDLYTEVLAASLKHQNKDADEDATVPEEVFEESEPKRKKLYFGKKKGA